MQVSGGQFQGKLQSAIQESPILLEENQSPGVAKYEIATKQSDSHERRIGEKKNPFCWKDTRSKVLRR